MKALQLIKEFKKHSLNPYIEVPCSLLSPIIEKLTNDKECTVLNPANEAIAMGIASGCFLATQRIPMVLIQNSGLCNTLNALTSLNQIYKIPVLYLISWRGYPGKQDAPEHMVLGLKLKKILTTFNIPYEILSEKSYKKNIRLMINKIKASNLPGALLLPPFLLEKGNRSTQIRSYQYEMSEADAVSLIIRVTANQAYYVTTNGYISREAQHTLSTLKLEKSNTAFYMLGSMGHALPIALGLEKYIKSKKKIIVLDGDGGCLMHLGALASVGTKTKGKHAATNIIHIVLDNGVYASTGGQPTISGNIDFTKIAKGCNYQNVHSVQTVSSLRRTLTKFTKIQGPSFLHVKINNDTSDPKPRVSSRYSCEEIKQAFINDGAIYGTK